MTTQFTDIEDAVVTVLRTHDDFNKTNCMSGDLEGLAKGLERIVRVMYAKVQMQELTIRMVEHIWTLKIDIFVPYRGRIQDMEASLAEERQKVIETLDKYPRLDGLSGIIKAVIRNGDTPEPLMERRTGYRGQRLWFDIHQSITPARAG